MSASADPGVKPPSGGEGGLGPESDWSQVVLADAEFRAEANRLPFEASAEAAALLEICTSPDTVEACRAGLPAARWDSTLAKWKVWEPAEQRQLGEAIEGVVVALDAVHLKPTSILQRLRSGVGAACFGAATLIQARHGPRVPCVARCIACPFCLCAPPDVSCCASCQNLPERPGLSAAKVEPEPEQKPKLAPAVDAGSKANAVGAVAASVATAEDPTKVRRAPIPELAAAHGIDEAAFSGFSSARAAPHPALA
jgi:hypothetical protein